MVQNVLSVLAAKERDILSAVRIQEYLNSQRQGRLLKKCKLVVTAEKRTIRVIAGFTVGSIKDLLDIEQVMGQLLAGNFGITLRYRDNQADAGIMVFVLARKISHSAH